MLSSDGGSAAVLTFMRVAPGTSRSLNGAQQAMLSALCANANRLAVTGVANCCTALDLAERGLVTVTDGKIAANDAFTDSMTFARQVGMMPAIAVTTMLT